MRFLLLLLCLGALGVVAWFATARGLDDEGLRGAPQIQDLVQINVQAAMGNVGASDVVVATDGRDVALSGAVSSDAQRSAVLAAAKATRLVGRLTDTLEVIETVRPFTFSAEKSAEGTLALSGHVPTREVEDLVLSQARIAASGASVKSTLVIASGAPEGDWAGIANAGISALSLLNSGQFTLSDLEGTIIGSAADADAGAALLTATEAVPSVHWTLDIAGPDLRPNPYLFTAEKRTGGTLALAGYAPDEGTRELLTVLAREISKRDVVNDLVLAPGIPDPAWPQTVANGLGALKYVRTGTLTVTGMEVAITGEVALSRELATLSAVVEPDWLIDVAIAEQAPKAAMALTLAADGTLAITGTLPKGLTKAALADSFGLPSPAAVDATPVPTPGDWSAALDALVTVLPRMATADAKVSDQKFALNGTLRRGYSADGSAAAVQSVMPRNWVVALELAEPPPLAAITLSKRAGEIVLSGVLPDGLTVSDALGIFGDTAGGEGVSTGGEGNIETWRTNLGVLARGLPFFQNVTLTAADGQISLDGQLLAGYVANDVQDWMQAALAPDWNLGLVADTTEAEDGDVRTVLTTGERETFRSGFWLPQLDFSVSSDTCQNEIDNALAETQIQFLTGSARIERTDRTLLNQLAAISQRCVGATGVRLEIAGHTDAIGDPSANQRLSEARARAVLAALVERGVPEQLMTAQGFGEDQPVADNTTPEGRALNRRITFTWSEAQN